MTVWNPLTFQMEAGSMTRISAIVIISVIGVAASVHTQFSAKK